MCAAVWRDRDEFIVDNSLVINGYQTNFDYLEHGLFYFTHEVEGCFSTMAMKVKEFFGLNPQKKYTQRKTLTEHCPRHCLDKDNLQMCPAECEYAYVRDLLGTLQRLKEGSSVSLKKNHKVNNRQAGSADHA
tara:strand:- start:98 stop:493 length:396 start_codon:yes stop_codon:yes gene_type:complete